MLQQVNADDGNLLRTQ